MLSELSLLPEDTVWRTPNLVFFSGQFCFIELSNGTQFGRGWVDGLVETIGIYPLALERNVYKVLYVTCVYVKVITTGWQRVQKQ